MQDPTHDEMLDHLKSTYGSEPDEFDVEEAIYWFACDYHGGQSSNLYSALCGSLYSPGPITNGCPTDSMSALMYEALEAEFGQ
jgi:hypothetical protein